MASSDSSIRMRLPLFWRLGLINLVLLTAVLVAVGLFVSNVLREAYLGSVYAELESLARLIESRPPDFDDEADLKAFALSMPNTGARLTVIAADGKVLADSQSDPSQMENHGSRPEIRQAFAGGRGTAVRFSDTLSHEMVYLAHRFQTATTAPVVIRVALPLSRLQKALSTLHWSLWTASIAILVLGGGVSLFIFHDLTTGIRELKRFSQRVADGDFRPLPISRRNDELSDLGSTLNETAARLDRTIRTLTEERNQSSAILRSMTEGVAVVGSDRRLAFCNRAFLNALAIASPAWQGSLIEEIISQSDILEIIQKALAGDESVHSEVVLGTLRTRSFTVTAAPIRSNGSMMGAVVVLHDITELRRLERARRDFVANLSHEFKTPLTAIQGFAETLLAGALDDKGNRRRFVEIIRSNATRLGRLTEDLGRLSEIEAGKVRLEIRTVSVAELIEPCVETARMNAASGKLVLEVVLSPNLPEVTGDIAALQEIIQNLLDNAVRYTPSKGRITIRGVARAEEVVISVSDTGIGIPSAEQERIFERFYRVDAARSRELGGTGLGLSIAKHLAELHGGRVEVESEVGAGSTFSVVLPRH